MTVTIGADSHVHLWDRDRFRYPWLEEAGDALPWRFLPSDLPDKDGRPGALVFVQADCLPEQGVAEAAWAASLVGEWGVLGAVVAFAPVELGTLAEWLDSLQAVPLVSGIRRLLQDEPTDLVTSAEVARGVRMLGTRQLSFDACIRSWQLGDLLWLARSAPDTSIVLDHLAKPPLRDGWDSEGARAWQLGIRELAALPNLTVKLSGLALETDGGSLVEQARPFLEEALEAFGANRSMIGSDLPVSAMPANAVPYEAWFGFVASLGASEQEQRELLGDTAARIYLR